MDYNQWPVAVVGLSSAATSILIGAKVLRTVYMRSSKNKVRKQQVNETETEKEKEKETTKKEQEEPFLVVVPSKKDYANDPELQIPIMKRLNWPMVVYLGGVHLLGLYWLLSLPFGLDSTMWQTYLFSFLLWPITGFGITAGAHRLWAHRSYKASAPLRFILMIFNSVANQGTIWHWARDHRTHHMFSDTPADPYDSYRGVFYSHMGWLLLRKHPKVVASSRRFVDMEDLKKDSFVMLQKRYDPWWNIFWCFVLPSYIPMLWGETLFQGYLVAAVVRYMVVLHTTWTVNSVVHKWGPKPYQKPPAKLALKEETEVDEDDEKDLDQLLAHGS